MPGRRSETPVERSGQSRRERLDAARLYLILDARPHGRPAAEILRAALAGGVGMVQLRDKEADEETLRDAAAEFRAACDERGALLLLNDRPELALECGADGVHLGQDDPSVDEARALLGADALVGVSTHTPGQVATARDSLADYIGVGPVYPTPTKPGARPVGEALVRHASERAQLPFFAIGGIDASNARSVAAAGAKRVAVVRAIRDADDPRAAAAALLTAIGPVGDDGGG